MIRRRLLQLAAPIFAAFSAAPFASGNGGFVERRKAYLDRVLSTPSPLKVELAPDPWQVAPDQKWEYLHQWLGHANPERDHLADMNVLGAKGWELCSVSGSYAFFKRPLVSDDNLG